MADFDEACRYAAKLDEAGFFAWLLGADAGLVFTRWLDTRTVALPGSGDRTGDLIAELAEGGVGPFWAVPVEFQVPADPEMHDATSTDEASRGTGVGTPADALVSPHDQPVEGGREQAEDDPLQRS